MTKSEIIDQIKKIDQIDEYRLSQLKTLYDYKWYEESIKDVVHCQLMKDLVDLKLIAERMFGKYWYK